MVKSKFNINALFSVLFFPLALIICLSLLLHTFSDSFHVEQLSSVKHQNGSNNILLLSLVSIAFLFSFIGNIIFFKQIRKISVDKSNHIIIVDKYFPKSKIVLDSKKITGYYSSIKSSKYGSFEVLILVSNNIVVATISSYYYSNYNEIKNSLNEFPYLGILQYNLLDKIKWMKGQPIAKRLASR